LAIPIPELAERIERGEPRAIAKAITLADEGEAAELLIRLYGKGGRARVVGVTGPPGAGKSTLVDKLTRTYRSKGLSVGIVAVDPTSPFTGGAILGDRIRMQDLTSDEGVFIRSLATRGALGGLSRATADAIEILDASGKDVILVETVGVGQDEVEVALVAETVLVVLVPGLGDEIQAMKAGIIEIGDVFVVNKADKPGADRAQKELHAMLTLTLGHGEEPPEIVRTIAESGEGVAELVEAVERHRELVAKVPAGHGRSATERARRRTRERLRSIIKDQVLRRVDERFLARVDERTLDALSARTVDPYTLARELVEGA
jgi:LAO/AO transport system kinase